MNKETEERVLRNMEAYEKTCDEDGCGIFGLATPQVERELLRDVLSRIHDTSLRSPDTIASHMGGSLLAWHQPDGNYFTCVFNSSTKFMYLRWRGATPQHHNDWPENHDAQINWLLDHIRNLL